MSAVTGCERDEAVYALASAYYKFAKEHPDLYKITLSLPMMKNDALLIAAGDIVEPIMGVLSQYGLHDEQQMHLQRVLRSILHGFISQEAAGCFRRFPVDISDSFHFAIRCFLDGLHEMEKL